MYLLVTSQTTLQLCLYHAKKWTASSFKYTRHFVLFQSNAMNQKDKNTPSASVEFWRKENSEI